MAILANRIKVKNHLAELCSFSFYLVKRFFSILLIIFSLYILYYPTPKFLSSLILEVTGNIFSVGTMLQNQTINSAKWFNTRFSYFRSLETDNLELKTKLAQMQKKLDILSNLETENQTLHRLLQVSQKVKTKFVTAKIISITNNHLANSMMVAAGRKDRVKENDLVFGEKGLIGRINQVSDNYANILLINDPRSRIPIITNKSKARGIIARRQDELKIIYLEDNHNISIGELIHSSGDGQIFPKNLPIALVTDIIDNDIMITALEKLHQLDYVIIQPNPAGTEHQ